MQYKTLKNILVNWLFLPVITSVSGYTAFVGVMHAMQRSFMYHPYPLMTSPAALGMTEMREVRLLSRDSMALISWYAPPKNAKPTVLYCHGNAGNIATRAFKVRPFLQNGYGVLMVGYRGYGSNPGTPSESGLSADAETAFQYLRAQSIPSNHIVIYGESLGSGVAVSLAATHNPGALILEAAFTSAVDVAKTTYWYLPVEQLMKDRFDSIKRIAQVHAPVLMLHGERDGVVPIALGKRLFAAAPSPKEFVTIPGGMHANLHEHGVAQRAIDFIKRHVLLS